MLDTDHHRHSADVPRSGERQRWLDAGAVAAYLRQVDLFRGLPEPEIERMATVLETYAYTRGELIVSAQSPRGRIYIVKDGLVRLFHRGPDGREITADTVGRGHLFGASAFFVPDGEPLLAEAATDAVVCQSSAVQFLRLAARWPRMMVSLVQQVGERLLRTRRRLAHVAASGARGRLAMLLMQRAIDAGEDAPGGGKLLPPGVTHAALAREIGASRETVTRLLGELVTAGLVRRHGRRLIVTDPARLAEYAPSEPKAGA